MGEGHEQAGGDPVTADQPGGEDRSEIDQRAAYEAELNRITSSEMILQTAVSLLNIGARRLGLAPSPVSSSEAPAPGERDLEQVRDAIDGASALLPILERRMPRELGPLRDALTQLRFAYAREAQSAGATTATVPHAPAGEQATAAEQAATGEHAKVPAGERVKTAEQAPADEQAKTAEQAPADEQAKTAEQAATTTETAEPANPQKPSEDDSPKGPGPAQASGRLWVPGR